MAVRIKISTKTVANFRREAHRITQVAKTMPGVLGVNLRMIAEEILTDVKAAGPGRGVPVDEGTLKDTGRAHGPVGAKQPKVSIAFGSAAAAYALIQHERTDFHHDIGESRYLVRGLERWQPGGSAAMAALKANTEAAIRLAGP